MGKIGALGCSAAASPLVTPVVFASAPTDTRLVVIILRGAMDGLDAVQPYGDPNLAKWRDGMGVGPKHGALDLDGFYALHPALSELMPLWKSGELGFVHAVRGSSFQLEPGCGSGVICAGATFAGEDLQR